MKLSLTVPQRRVAAAWAVALAFGAGAFHLADLSARVLPRPSPLEELSYYPSGNHLRGAALGHTEAAADLAWLRAVQYYGEHRRTDVRFTRMYHVFDILTTLSPRFVPAYTFGAFALAQEGFDFLSAERLIHKGLENNPASGPLAFEMGFLYFMKPGGRDLRRAAEYFEQASRQADAPPQAARFAAFARQHAGDLMVAWLLWAQVREHSRNHYMREVAEREMDKIRVALETGRRDGVVKRLTTPGVILLPPSR